MPFDGNTATQRSLAASRPVSRPLQSLPGRRRDFKLDIIAVLCVMMAIACLTEVVLPNHGLITRVLFGNAVADRNAVAISLIPSHSEWLVFTVAGHRYMVMPPVHLRNPDEEQAWLGYAKWMKWPAYSVDGPFVIDP